MQSQKLDAAQIRAAIGLLNWENKDLAKACKVTAQSISNIKRGATRPHPKVLASIQHTLEANGVEFLENSGVRLRPSGLEVFEGEGASRKLVEDLYYTMQKTGGEILIAHLDEGDAIRTLELDWLAEQIRKRKEAGITHRLLVQADDPNLIPPFDSYRCIPKEFFSPYPLYIYANKLALMSWETAPRAIIVEDERFAESMRKLFNFIWSHAQPVPSKKSGKPTNGKH